MMAQDLSEEIDKSPDKGINIEIARYLLKFSGEEEEEDDYSDGEVFFISTSGPVQPEIAYQHI